MIYYYFFQSKWKQLQWWYYEWRIYWSIKNHFKDRRVFNAWLSRMYAVRRRMKPNSYTYLTFLKELNNE